MKGIYLPAILTRRLLVTLPLFIILFFRGHGFPEVNPAPGQLAVSHVSAEETAATTPELVFMEGGLFLFGDPTGAAHSALPLRRIEVDGFFISRYEITFNEFDVFCLDEDLPLPPDGGYGRGRRPATNVSWYDAAKYCNWLSRTENLQECYEFSPGAGGGSRQVRCILENNGYRLPTEAEWEYAARGGKGSRGHMYAGSDDIDEVAWYFSNSGRYPEETGSKQPNESGLYDMSGNAYEWTGSYLSGDYSAVSDGAANPTGPDTGTSIAMRGGSCFFDSWGCRVWYRKGLAPSNRLPYVGFRVVRRAYQ